MKRLQAEYVPVPTMDLGHARDLITGLLNGAVPNLVDAKFTMVTMSAENWADALWNSDAEDMPLVHKPSRKGEGADIYCTLGEDDEEEYQNDWVGVARDKRSAYLILGALKSDGLV